MFSFGIKDIIDIFSVAILLYYIYRLMKESSSANIFGGIMVFIVVWIFVSQIFEMRLLGTILDKVVNVGSLALIVLFQEEIRHFSALLAHDVVHTSLHVSLTASAVTRMAMFTARKSCLLSWLV